MKKKTLALLVALVLVFGAAVGGTIAWLTDKTEVVKNTFTIGNINIDLDETTEDYKMIPGETIDKDPTITVEAGSEACWLFVKVEESSNLDDFVTYAMADGWTALEDVDGVYYRQVDAVSSDTDYAVLAGNEVTVKDTVTKPMMDELTENTCPTLTFTAYAVQQSGFETAAKAWAEASK